MRRLDTKRLRSEDGATMVEFSLVAVMFIIVLLGVVEMARMVLVYTTMANAARAGARYAIVHGANRTGSGADGPSGPGCGPSSCTQINTVVKNYAGVGLLNSNNVTVTVSYPNTSNAVGSLVTVSVSYTYDPLIGYFRTLVNKNLSSSSQGVIVF